MSTAMIYRPNNHRLTWVAFECAITIYVTAIAIAENRAKPVTISSWEAPGEIVDGTFDPPSENQETDIVPPPQIIPDDQQFTEDKPARMPVSPRKKTPVSPIRSASPGTGQAINSGAVKALTLYAPKPSYPYEARRGGVTGSGVARLAVDSAAGNVIDARMSQSTGSAILDGVTVEALRRWRFKSGVASNIEVPITFTLTGVSY